MLWVAGRSPTLVSHSEAWRRHESSGDNLNLPSYTMALITGTGAAETINVPDGVYSGGVNIDGNAPPSSSIESAKTANNLITGAGGADTIIAGVGNDTIVGYDTAGEDVDGGAGIDTLQTTGALAFLEQLKNTKSVYLQNPAAARRLEQLKSQNRSYLVHEYFNEHWTALYFDQVHDSMERAKLTYIGSAHLIDNMDNLNLTGEAIQELAKIHDPVYREVVRDFYLNTTFRRDVYVRGVDMLTPAAQTEQFRAMKFMLTVEADQVKLEHQTALGKLQLQENVYQPITNCLREAGVLSIAELEAKLSTQGINLQRLIQSLLVMTGMSYTHPLVEGTDPTAAQRFNQAVLQRSLQDGSISYLCSPVIGNGVMVPRLEQWCLLGELDPQQSLEHLWDSLKASGVKFTKEGKTLETPEENWQFLQESAEKFALNRRPILKKLGI